LPWAVEEALCASVALDIVGTTDENAEGWWLRFMALWGVTGAQPEVLIEYDPAGLTGEPVSIGSVSLDYAARTTAPATWLSGMSLRCQDGPSDELSDMIWRGQAYFVVQRVISRFGLHKTMEIIRSMAMASTSEDEWFQRLSDLAELPSDLRQWRGPLQEELSTVDPDAAFLESGGFRWQSRLGERGGIGFPVNTLSVLMREFSGPTPDGLFERGRLRLSLAGTTANTLVVGVPLIRQELEEAWAARLAGSEE
jgi:hypothetical protein